MGAFARGGGGFISVLRAQIAPSSGAVRLMGFVPVSRLPRAARLFILQTTERPGSSASVSKKKRLPIGFKFFASLDGPSNNKDYLLSSFLEGNTKSEYIRVNNTQLLNLRL
jgi:hypothetical protein